MGYVFKQGVATVATMYDTMLQLMKNAGWSDISSRPSTDDNVMYSTGEDGTRQLCVRLRKYSAAAPYLFYVMFCASYVPGAPGSSGVFGRPSTALTASSFTNINSSGSTNYPWFPNGFLDVPLTYRYHANKNRIILVVEYVDYNGDNQVMFTYLGLPDETYTADSGSRGLVCLSNAYNSVTKVSDYGEGNASTDAVTATCCVINRNSSSSIDPVGPLSSGSYQLMPVFYDDGQCIRARLSGIYTIKAKQTVHGDIVKIGNRSFYLAAISQSGFFNYFLGSVTTGIRFMAIEI